MKISYLFKNIIKSLVGKINSALAEAKAYTDNSWSDIGTYTVATGTTVTKAWSTPDVTTTWTAPSDGVYLITIHMATANDTSYTSTYKMFRWWGTACALLGDGIGLYFRGTTDGAQYGINGNAWTFPVLALQGQTVKAFMYTGTAGITYNVSICGIKVGKYVNNN